MVCQNEPIELKETCGLAFSLETEENKYDANLKISSFDTIIWADWFSSQNIIVLIPEFGSQSSDLRGLA